MEEGAEPTKRVNNYLGADVRCMNISRKNSDYITGKHHFSGIGFFNEFKLMLVC